MKIQLTSDILIYICSEIYSGMRQDLPASGFTLFQPRFRGSPVALSTHMDISRSPIPSSFFFIFPCMILTIKSFTTRSLYSVIMHCSGWNFKDEEEPHWFSNIIHPSDSDTEESSWNVSSSWVNPRFRAPNSNKNYLGPNVSSSMSNILDLVVQTPNPTQITPPWMAPCSLSQFICSIIHQEDLHKTQGNETPGFRPSDGQKSVLVYPQCNRAYSYLQCQPSSICQLLRATKDSIWKIQSVIGGNLRRKNSTYLQRISTWNSSQDKFSSPSREKGFLLRSSTEVVSHLLSRCFPLLVSLSIISLFLIRPKKQSNTSFDCFSIARK